MHRFILILLIGLNALDAFAGLVRISGKAPDYPGRRIALFMQNDEFSEKKKLLAVADISDDGSFSLECDIESVRRLTMLINRVEAILFAEPSEEYQVVFPPAASADVQKFDKTSVELIFENPRADELNQRIRAFNSDYAAFFNEHYYDFALDRYRGSDVYLKHLNGRSLKADLFNGTGKPDTLVTKLQPRFNGLVGEFCKRMESEYIASASSDFLKEYVFYSLAELKWMAGMNRNEFYREFWMSRKPAIHNPAYADCFHLFYGHYLQEQPRELQDRIKKAINIERSATRLLEITSLDSSAQSNEIRAIAILLSLRDLHNNKAFTRSAVERTLENFGELPDLNDGIRMMANDILFELRKCKENWLLEDLILVDDREERWALAEQEGQLVYLYFFASWNTASLKEMLMIQKFWEKYRKDVLFVAVNMDDDYSTFRKYLQEHPEEKFLHVFGNGDPLIADKCDLRSIPHAIMLNEDGRFRSNFTRRPSEGVQMELDKIVLEHAQKKSGPKTWKD